MPLCRPNVVEPGWRVLEVSEPPLAMPVPAVPSFGGAASSDAGGAAGLKAGAGAGAPVSQPGRRTVAVQSLFQDSPIAVRVLREAFPGKRQPGEPHFRPGYVAAAGGAPAAALRCDICV